MFWRRDLAHYVDILTQEGILTLEDAMEVVATEEGNLGVLRVRFRILLCLKKHMSSVYPSVKAIFLMLWASSARAVCPSSP